MKGFLSDAGADTLKSTLQEHYQRDGRTHGSILALVLAVEAGWFFCSSGTVHRLHEPVKLTWEVAYEILTGRSYWRTPKLPVEKLFECKSFEEMWQKAEELTNGYIKR